MRENGRVCRLKYRADISDGIFTGSGGRKVETAKCPKLPKMETHIFSPLPGMRENGRVCRLKYRADISDGIFTGSGGRKVETAKCPKLPKMETHI